MKIKYLIEIKNISPAMYYAGYEVRGKKDCPSGETESVLYKFTEDIYSAKQFVSKKLAEDILEKLPAVKFYCGVFEHGFGG